MNKLLQHKLNIATTLDKQWSPSIYMQLDTAQNFVDFVPMLKPSNLDKSMFLSKGYPLGASFCFYGYNGKEDFNALKGAILTASKSSGTDLTVLSKVRLSKVRAIASKKVYNSSCIQQYGTILFNNCSFCSPNRYNISFEEVSYMNMHQFSSNKSSSCVKTRNL